VTVIAERTSAASSERDVLSLTADGTIGGSLRRDTAILLTKNGVANITLEAPGSSHEGLKLDILSSRPFSHVITAAGLIDDGPAGARNTLTFADFVGASVMLQARKGHWVVLRTNAVTVA